MDELITYDAQLTKADRLVLEDLARDIRDGASVANPKPSVEGGLQTLAALDDLNDPTSVEFEPTVFSSVDLSDLQVSKTVNAWLLQPYIRLASHIVRHKTDVLMLTHLILYFTTTLPSAAFLFWRFTWPHAIIHFLMQVWSMGAYNIMMHQHIHQRGILRKELGLLDHLFPYVLDPFFGHTWNSYFYHHVKHHHVEGNGPDDLSSTIRYQRDDPFHFLQYFCRFFFLAWIELPLYFVRTNRTSHAIKNAFWEYASWANMYFFWTRVNANAAFMTMVLPFLLLRFGLMLGNWGQHAFVDDMDPDSDYRSSITTIDVTSNRFCFNDGYHTSHHLNPMRHWREHPNHFVKSKAAYADEQALVFHNIDFIMISVRLFRKDYMHLARCLVPMGDQIKMTMEERAEMLRRHTRAFSEVEVARKFPKARSVSLRTKKAS